MYTIYRIKTEELDNSFIDAVKTTFRNKEVEIAVCEVSDIEEDETAYLLKSPANREQLLEAIKNVAQDRNLVTFDSDELR